VQVAIKNTDSDDDHEEAKIAFEWFPLSFDEEEMKIKIEFNDTN
jgi:hypothetical protein